MCGLVGCPSGPQKHVPTERGTSLTTSHFGHSVCRVRATPSPSRCPQDSRHRPKSFRYPCSRPAVCLCPLQNSSAAIGQETRLSISRVLKF